MTLNPWPLEFLQMAIVWEKTHESSMENIAQPQQPNKKPHRSNEKNVGIGQSEVSPDLRQRCFILSASHQLSRSFKDQDWMGRKS
jgi:hypothetical protein